MDAKVDLGHEVNEHVVTRKLNMHILTKFFIMTIMCYLDRTNLAFAALQLNKSLGFSEHVYGVGSSVFFIGYALCQVNSSNACVCVCVCGFRVDGKPNLTYATIA